MSPARIVALLAVLLVAAPASAQTAAFTPDPVDLAAAKREGNVTWYTSTPIEAAQKIVKLFEAETGIKVELFRSGGTATLQRFLREIDAKPIPPPPARSPSRGSSSRSGRRTSTGSPTR
jgi:iron(III) transport system substrate-binding protein